MPAKKSDRSIYISVWLSDAKLKFSKSNCVA